MSYSCGNRKEATRDGNENVQETLKIGIVVVESHQHALEHIHQALRRLSLGRRKNGKYICREDKSKIEMKQWSMVHFDSHPDMACLHPSIPAAACFTPRRTWLRHKFEDRTITTQNSSDEKDQEDNTNFNNSESNQHLPVAKENLYEMLDLSRSGIAEWILPLCFAAGLKKIHWIRSKWANQFCDGEYKFYVGAWTPTGTDRKSEDGSSPIRLASCLSHKADRKSTMKEISSFLDLPDSSVMKVSLPHPYYYDDGSVVPEHELMLRKEVQLYVHRLESDKFKNSVEASRKQLEGIRSEGEGVAKKTEEEEEEENWVLDICLDYFACLNPFITELEFVDARFTRAMLRAVEETNFRRLETHNYETELKKFNVLVTNFFQGVILGTETVESRKVNKEVYYLYSSSALGRCIWNDVEKALFASGQEKIIARLVLDGLLNFTLPHSIHSVQECNTECKESFENNKSLECSTEEFESSVALQRVKEMGAALRQYFWDSKNFDENTSRNSDHHFVNPLKPMLITIARSSQDGFTPNSLVEHLQWAVLKEVHELYCGCEEGLIEVGKAISVSELQVEEGRTYSEKHVPFFHGKHCKCELIFDYGVYEGSTFDSKYG